MKRTKFMLAAFFALSLAACDSGDPKDLIMEGNAAMGANDSTTALSKFEGALKSLKEGDALYFDARLGKVEALIAVEPSRATEEFLELAKTFPDQVGEKEIVYMSGKLVSSHRYSEAIYVVQDGIQRAGTQVPALMAMIDRIKQEGANDKAANKLLRTLGYL